MVEGPTTKAAGIRLRQSFPLNFSKLLKHLFGTT